MNEIITFLIVLIVLFVFENIYFRIADRYNIIDKPNHRSSHNKVTIRGGGIIFGISLTIWFFYDGFSLPFFFSGLLLITLISFIDDISTLSSGIRSLIHLFAVSLALYQVDINIDFYWWPLILLLIVGSINAYNFMDGINGITGGYSLVLLGSLFYINLNVLSFTSENLLTFTILSLLVFNFFNFRAKAKCFAGDVGSVSIAFIICFLLLQLMFQTENLLFIFFLLVYGLDAVTTILFRLIRKENILEAHRSHFYQYLANERQWPHLHVAALYALVQGIINIALIYFFSTSQGLCGSMWYLPILLVVAGISFIFLRIIIEGNERLFAAKLSKGKVKY